MLRHLKKQSPFPHIAEKGIVLLHILHSTIISALFRKKLKKAKCARPQDADERKGNVSNN